MKSEILVPFSFLPDVRPGKVGPVFELRYYTLKPGTLPDTAKGWEAKVPERTKLSPLVVAGGVEFGQANGFIHIWAYSSMDQRMKIRDEARQKGVWPPPGAPIVSSRRRTRSCCQPRSRRSSRSLGRKSPGGAGFVAGAPRVFQIRH